MADEKPNRQVSQKGDALPDPVSSIVETMSNLFIGALIGSWIGYRYGIKSDRRKEYNEIAEPIAIRCQFEIAPGGRPISFEANEIEMLRRRLGPIQRWRFNAAYAAYNSAVESSKIQNSLGQYRIPEVEAVNKALKRIRKTLPRK